MVIYVGDSLTRSPYLGAWAIGGDGKTAEDQTITDWMHAGTSTAGLDTLDGFYLQSPSKSGGLGYHCSARSYTVGDGRGPWHFMDNSGMPDISGSQAAARAALEDCSSYPNDLSLTTILSAVERPQFAVATVNLSFGSPGTLDSSFVAMHDLFEARGIVPIIVTYTYRQVYNDDPGSGTTTEQFNTAVDSYNAALRSFAQERGYPLIDFQKEMEMRIPLSGKDSGALQAWNGRFLSGDGVHYTGYGGGYTATSNPYADGGDAATHATGLAFTYSGYALKGWLIVQKMKEIRAEVIDQLVAPNPPTNLTVVP